MISKGYIKFKKFFCIYCLTLTYAEMISVCHLVAETSDMSQSERDYLIEKINKYYGKVLDK